MQIYTIEDIAKELGKNKLVIKLGIKSYKKCSGNGRINAIIVPIIFKVLIFNLL